MSETRAGDAAVAEGDVLGLLMLAFEGETIPAWLATWLADAPPAGFTIFRHHNVRSPDQLRELTDALQAAAPPGLPFLIAADQEGGQFQALGIGPTQFAGAMALGAAGDETLAERVGRAIGTELAAMGVNVCYAPVADVAVTQLNPALGIRAFGADAGAVAGMVAATVHGIESTGVAATVKHFPGKGAVATDTHHALGIVDHDRARLDAVELAPFRAAIEAGVGLVMSGHFAVPGLTGDPGLPATLARDVMTGLLRDELGFAGVAITDALDMKALDQGPNQVLDALAALRAGVDLLLLATDPEGRERIATGLRHAARRRLLDADAVGASLARVAALRRRVAATTDPLRRPDLSVVGGARHLALSRELADRSLTLVRDDDGLLPMRLDGDRSILAVMPRPVDLTPADTSSTVEPGLAAALRAVHPRVDEAIVDIDPDDAAIGAVRARAAAADAVVVGTIAATPGSAQARLVEAILATGTPTITVALRTPWDLDAYPGSRTHLCTYSILPDPLAALADALVGRLVPAGRLPVPLEAARAGAAR
jgi:beta-N-acetylhexosaminidase